MEETDIVAKNGRIYTLEGVLIPPTIVPILPHWCDKTSQDTKVRESQWICISNSSIQGIPASSLRTFSDIVHLKEIVLEMSISMATSLAVLQRGNSYEHTLFHFFKNLVVALTLWNTLCLSSPTLSSSSWIPSVHISTWEFTIAMFSGKTTPCFSGKLLQINVFLSTEYTAKGNRKLKY